MAPDQAPTLLTVLAPNVGIIVLVATTEGASWKCDGPRCVIAHPALLRWQSDPSATTTEPPLVGSNASQCCDHRLCHHECLLKLEVCIIRFGRVEPWEIRSVACSRLS